jgi:hypothetical protein
MDATENFRNATMTYDSETLKTLPHTHDYMETDPYYAMDTQRASIREA